MSPIFNGAVFAITLGAGIIVAIEIGRRIGTKRFAKEGELAGKGFSAIEGAVFGLMGLFLAFSFSGALARFDARRQLIVAEANNIGTAWLRIDLLPAEAQGPIRELFRRYVDSRLETYRLMPDIGAAKAELANTAGIQREIWKSAVSPSRTAPNPQAAMLLLPALNEMFDITTTRTEAAIIHSPPIIFFMLGIMALACSLFAGYDMASRKRPNRLHSSAFAVVLAVTVYVIIDLEYPRIGLITVKASDQVLVALRESMN